MNPWGWGAPGIGGTHLSYPVLRWRPVPELTSTLIIVPPELGSESGLASGGAGRAARPGSWEQCKPQTRLG